MVMTDIKRAALTAPQLPERPVVMVDNTFLGPAFQHPMTLGADLVVYSATKYLGGFSDLLAGVVLGIAPELNKKIRGKRGLFGNILQPDECWILDGRLPTVTLRMNRQSKNAQRIAESLVHRPEVRKVYYPTLFDDPEQIRIRLSQCDYPGAMIALDLHGGKRAAFEFLRSVRLAHNAVSLGGMETLVCHPKTTTHSGCSEEELQHRRHHRRTGAHLGGRRGLARPAAGLRTGPGPRQCAGRCGDGGIEAPTAFVLAVRLYLALPDILSPVLERPSPVF